MAERVRKGGALRTIAERVREGGDLRTLAERVRKGGNVKVAKTRSLLVQQKKVMYAHCTLHMHYSNQFFLYF